MKKLQIIALCCISLAIIQTTNANADDNSAEQKKPVLLQSTYQHAPVKFGMNKKGSQIIRITGQKIENGESVEVQLDPNICTLNEFGDTVVCTEMAGPRIKAVLIRLRTADPLNLGRKLFRVDSKEFPKSLVVYLVVPTTDSGYRIVLKKPESKVVVALEKVTEATKPKTTSDNG